ncbi:hypothetical protein AC249_AIPGENE16766 [Exaiptasia diaphana]|nr:hypothetical protein AC249_AIPGENE16766 [Exaiptasia diaphana]
MKKKDDNVVGSWKKAVTSSDGCWLIRGYHSQCASFVIIDFITNERMMTLGKYHARDIHYWTNADGVTEECVFHPEIVCSCGNCPKRKGLDQMLRGEEDVEESDLSSDDSDEEEQEADKCAGQPYSTKAALTFMK